MKRFDGSDSRCICSPNLITVTHENVLKPIHTVFVGKEIRVDVLHELPFDASQPLRRRFYFKIGQARIVLKCVTCPAGPKLCVKATFSLKTIVNLSTL